MNPRSLALAASLALLAPAAGAQDARLAPFIGTYVGTAVVLAFFIVGQVVVGRVLRSNPQVGMTAALLVYVLQLLALMIMLVLLREATWLDPKVFGFTVLAGVITWTLASVVVYNRSRRLTVVPGSGPGHPDGPASTTAGDSAREGS